MTDLRELAAQAKEAARVLAGASEERKNRALENISDALLRHQDEILAANRADCDAARADGMSDAMLDRLTLTGARLERMAAAVRKVRDLPDPVGEVMEERVLENGLQLSKVRVPLGVVGIIRVAPQRDGRCRCAVPQVRQRRLPARRQRKHPVQHRA